MQAENGVVVFWDFETAKVEGKQSGYQAARNLSNIADQYGVVKSFRTYLDVMNQLDDDFPSIRKQLHSSGVTMVDCPSHSGRDIADKVIIVDMLSFILDQPPPYTIVVATGDNDLCFTLAVLRRRRYKVVLVAPLQRDCENLAMQADEIRRVDWIGAGSGNADNLSSPSSPSSSPSSIISYADFNTRQSVRSPIPNGRKVEFTTEQPKKLNFLHIPDLKPAGVGDGVEIESQPSDGGMTHSPGNAAQDVQDGEKPRGHTGILSGPFFPSPPSFPLEAPPKVNVSATKADKSVAGRKSPSPQSTGEFSVIDHPRDSLSNMASRNSLVATPISVVHQPLATSHVPTTGSSEFREVSSHSVAVPAAATQSTGNPPTPTLGTSKTDVPLAVTLPPIPVATSSITTTTTPIAKIANVPAPAPTPTISNEKTSKPATSRSLPVKYHGLVRLLQIYRRNGELWLNGSVIAATLVRANSKLYASAGVKRWGQYVAQAVGDGIIIAKDDKICLGEQWVNVSV